MNRRDTFILTHYTDIADTKQRDMRRLHAEATRSIVRGMVAAVLAVIQRPPRSNQEHGSEQA